MDIREKQVSERVADSLSLSQVDSDGGDIILDLNRKGERDYVTKAVSKELISYMNTAKWLKISYHNHRMKKSATALDYYVFSKGRFI
jgi:hypothetical protein